MKIIFQYTEDGLCDELEHFAEHVTNNPNFSMFETFVEKVEGSRYFRIKVMDKTGEVYNGHGLRLDLLSNWVIKYLNKNN